MKALQRASEEFFRSAGSKQKNSKFKDFWKNKQTVGSKVEQLRQTNPKTLIDAKKFILDIVDERKAEYGKVNELHPSSYVRLTVSQFYSAFHRICGSLNAHSDLFKIVPSQNLYMSVLSGSLSMIVQVSVTY